MANLQTVCKAGDKVTLTYENPHKTDVFDERSGIVDRVGKEFVTLKVDQHAGAFRTYAAAFITDIRVL